MLGASRRFGQFLEDRFQGLTEAALERWLKALRENARSDLALDGLRRIARLGPAAQEAAAAVVARLAGRDELREVLNQLEGEDENEAAQPFMGALRARSALPHAAEQENDSET